ncbi:MAG: CvpA family protein [Campylobacteraceae bacterium]|jgi:membrane protein required for colicin V production|nr:CvpA family protein [Campylobacteraceae bacterium]
MDFSWFDILTIIIIALIGIRGAINGFIKELFNLLGLAGGIFLAARFANNVGKIINENIYTMHNEAAAQLVGFVITLLFVWFFCFMAGLIISKLFNLGIMAGINRFLGFVFCCLKMFLIFSVIIFALSNIEFARVKLDNALENSFLYEKFLFMGSKILDMELKTIHGNMTDITEDAEENIEFMLDNISEITSDDINISLTPIE